MYTFRQQNIKIFTSDFFSLIVKLNRRHLHKLITCFKLEQVCPFLKWYKKKGKKCWEGPFSSGATRQEECKHSDMKTKDCVLYQSEIL